MDKRLDAHESPHPAATGQVDVVGGFKVVAAVILAQFGAETSHGSGRSLQRSRSTISLAIQTGVDDDVKETTEMEAAACRHLDEPAAAQRVQSGTER